MDTSIHNMQGLFQQLGLPSEPKQIEQFIRQHRCQTGLDPLEGAPFWSPSQAHFIQEALYQDSDWTEVVDELNCRLHQ
ncbi:DUF2789 domain-containing protein [Motiliproteus coralliicola]|uniref:DUF2789 domain-containing protein n=1 Tax=Motiliproteus coralliicola TaxID=2283196 RepID=A0A369WTX5_9GAMM|nr:DUF2789 domain-containing protein [Motiliproteus coralliicola]RDE25051.1 DUF2789 domain-containing protein [Motiliproteus coralliicola]